MNLICVHSHWVLVLAASTNCSSTVTLKFLISEQSLVSISLWITASISRDTAGDTTPSLLEVSSVCTDFRQVMMVSSDSAEVRLHKASMATPVKSIHLPSQNISVLSFEGTKLLLSFISSALFCHHILYCGSSWHILRECDLETSDGINQIKKCIKLNCP